LFIPYKCRYREPNKVENLCSNRYFSTTVLSFQSSLNFHSNIIKKTCFLCLTCLLNLYQIEPFELCPFYLNAERHTRSLMHHWTRNSLTFNSARGLIPINEIDRVNLVFHQQILSFIQGQEWCQSNELYFDDVPVIRSHSNNTCHFLDYFW